MARQQWRAACIQAESVGIRAEHGVEQAAEIKSANLDRCLTVIDVAMAAEDAAPDLVLLAEWAFTGPPREETIPDWIEKACEPLPGPLSNGLSEAAARHKIFIGANQWEIDEEWPGRFFNTSFLIDPSGELILVARRVHTSSWCSPHDLMDAYLERYGLEGTFPVVETSLGRIGMVTCGEIAVPEASRALMMRGAEVILHPTNENFSAGQELAKQARAVENMVYVVSTNVAGTNGFGGQEDAAGRSRIVDYAGRTLALERSHKETADVVATIDVEALREARRDLSMANQLLGLRLEMYLPVFEQSKTHFYPANQFLERPIRDDVDIARVRALALASLVESGVSRGPTA